ncbi:hypothetical protein [Streptomyces sp. JNUCC 63]
MKTIARSVAVALLTAGAVVVPASAQAIAAPLHRPASATSAVHASDRDRHHSPYDYRHDGDLRRHHYDGRDYWRHDSHRHRYCGHHARWDRDCDRDRRHHSHRWDCYPYGRR